MMRPRRRRLVIALAVLAGLNVLAYLAFTLPRSLQQRNLGARLKIARADVERERERQNSLKARYDLITANTRDTTEFYQRRIGARGTSLVPALREVEALARARGLHVGNQTFDYEPMKGVPLDHFEVQMPVRGTYRQLVEFVEELERSSSFITLDQITVHAKEGGEAQLKMVLSVYFRSSGGRQGT